MDDQVLRHAFDWRPRKGHGSKLADSPCRRVPTRRFYGSRAHSHARLRGRILKKSTLPKKRGTEQRSMLDSRQVFRMSVRLKTGRASCLERRQSRTPKRACASTWQNMDLLPICSTILMAALSLLSSASQDRTLGNIQTMRPLRTLESCYEAAALCPAPSSLRRA